VSAFLCNHEVKYFKDRVDNLVAVEIGLALSSEVQSLTNSTDADASVKKETIALAGRRLLLALQWSA